MLKNLKASSVGQKCVRLVLKNAEISALLKSVCRKNRKQSPVSHVVEKAVNSTKSEIVGGWRTKSNVWKIL